MLVAMALEDPPLESGLFEPSLRAFFFDCFMHGTVLAALFCLRCGASENNTERDGRSEHNL